MGATSLRLKAISPAKVTPRNIRLVITVVLDVPTYPETLARTWL